MLVSRYHIDATPPGMPTHIGVSVHIGIADGMFQCMGTDVPELAEVSVLAFRFSVLLNYAPRLAGVVSCDLPLQRAPLMHKQWRFQAPAPLLVHVCMRVGAWACLVCLVCACACAALRSCVRHTTTPPHVPCALSKKNFNHKATFHR